MLHVTNGNSAAALIRHTGVEGTVLPWRDVLAENEIQALDWLARYPGDLKFDVVFVDPPYDANLQAAVLAALATRGALAPDARVYVEHRAREPLPELPAGWHSVRDGRAGEVGYHLLAT